jgi:hypothetical protein
MRERGEEILRRYTREGNEYEESKNNYRRKTKWIEILRL